MRYLMLVCVDPTGEKYVPEEDNIGEWVAEMDRRGATSKPVTGKTGDGERQARCFPLHNVSRAAAF